MTKKLNKARAFAQKPAVRRTRKILGAIGKCLLTILLIGIITGSLVTCIMVVFVLTKFDSDMGIPDLNNLTNETSIVYVQDSSGEFVEHQWLDGSNSIWVDLEDIPAYMQNAVIAIEDERFLSHNGVDWKRTVSAFANLIFHFDSTEYGGSTITQQLIKLITQDDDHSIERKITEILRALEMERTAASKDQILEAYLNVMPLTGNITGVGAGANTYFGKELKDCTLAECAVLASITNNPSYYNPYYHPDHVRERQRLVLYKMHELGFINDEEYIQALGEEIHYVNQDNDKHIEIQDYYTDLLIEDVIDGLMETYGYTYRYAENIVFHGGLRIYSAEDISTQNMIEEIYADDSNFPSNIAGYPEDPQAAIYIMDYNGRCVATVGGRGEKTQNRILLRDTQSTRSPGSSFKPIGVYAPALSLNLIHYSSMERDAYITLPDGSHWPANYESSPSDNGNVLLPYAIERSLNTVPVRILQEMGVETSYNFLVENFHITTLVDEGNITDKAYAPLALGALSNGVTCREMAAAFATFGDGGVYHKPLTYYRVEQDGDVILESDTTGSQALDTETAYVMNRLLQNVIGNSNGTAASLMGDWSGWEVFSKTGTAEYNNDVYFVGGTTYYVAASWFGYDNNYELVGDQVSYARILWNKCMKALHADLTPTTFDEFRGDTVERYYCTYTGQLAGYNCPGRALGVYKPDNIPALCYHGGGAVNGGGGGGSYDPGDGDDGGDDEPADTTTAAAAGTTTTSSATPSTPETTAPASEPEEETTTAAPPTEPTAAPPTDTDPTQAQPEPDDTPVE